MEGGGTIYSEERFLFLLVSQIFPLLQWGDALRKRLAWALFILLRLTFVWCQPTKLILSFFFYVSSIFQHTPRSWRRAWKRKCGTITRRNEHFARISPHPPTARVTCTLVWLSKTYKTWVYASFFFLLSSFFFLFFFFLLLIIIFFI